MTNQVSICSWWFTLLYYLNGVVYYQAGRLELHVYWLKLGITLQNPDVYFQIAFMQSEGLQNVLQLCCTTFFPKNDVVKSYS